MVVECPMCKARKSSKLLEELEMKISKGEDVVSEKVKCMSEIGELNRKIYGH